MWGNRERSKDFPSELDMTSYPVISILIQLVKHLSIVTPDPYVGKELTKTSADFPL